ncbi:hypothetical protein Hypma_008156 [Hypsizygus marmoreus]|uniref:Uncharacterized protein n=1 Tax=Hypsizygus marmoreus TaxID=39966 RepID=A0A369JVY1_HYPMA|nr:hypothetical protein Hypma_008156 [Hypsizygus marmoreus]
MDSTPFLYALLALPPCPPCYVVPTGQHTCHVTDQPAARRPPGVYHQHARPASSCYTAPTPVRRPTASTQCQAPTPILCLGRTAPHCPLHAPTLRPWKPGGQEHIAGSCSGPAAYGGGLHFACLLPASRNAATSPCESTTIPAISPTFAHAPSSSTSMSISSLPANSSSSSSSTPDSPSVTTTVTTAGITTSAAVNDKASPRTRNMSIKRCCISMRAARAFPHSIARWGQCATCSIPGGDVARRFSDAHNMETVDPAANLDEDAAGGAAECRRWATGLFEHILWMRRQCWQVLPTILEHSRSGRLAQ